MNTDAKTRDRVKKYIERLAQHPNGFTVAEWSDFVNAVLALCASSPAFTEQAEDTKRLDWLIFQGPPGAATGAGLNDELWEIATASVSDELQTDNQCIRAAIDATRAPSANGGKGT
jgi:hypothetical protein